MVAEFKGKVDINIIGCCLNIATGQITRDPYDVRCIAIAEVTMHSG